MRFQCAMGLGRSTKETDQQVGRLGAAPIAGGTIARRARSSAFSLRLARIMADTTATYDGTAPSARNELASVRRCVSAIADVASSS